MPKYFVRIDACFDFEVEAENATRAEAIAEGRFNPGEGYSHRTETLVFEEDGVTIAEEED